MNRLIFLLLTLIISSSVLMADLSREELNILVPSGSRFVTELSGNWERSKDMQEWTGIRIPISEQVEEKVIYKRFVKIPANMVDNYSWQLYILGTDHTVEIYWNEQFIGRYVGAMMPFNVRIPNNTVRNETNEIRLVVMPASGKVKQVRSQHLNAPREFTGIIREILLVGTPHAWISEVRNTIKLKSQNSAEIVSKINITSSEIKYLINKLRVKDSISLDGNEKISLSLNAELRALNTDLVIASGSSKTITVESDRTISENIFLHASGINLWSTENPELYKLTVSIKRNDLLIDDYSTNIGFKSIRTAESSDGAQLLLNGKQFMIKGISYIEDYQDLGRTLSSTKLFQDIDLIKKLGANTVRVKFYPPHPLFVNYCNAKGLHLMAELPNYDVPSDIINLDEIKVYNQNLAKQYLIHYDSEPSMFAWGLGEGVDENSQKYKYFSESIIKIFNSESDKLLYKILPHGIRQVNTDGYDFFGYSDIRQNVDFNQINNEFVRLGGLLNGKPLFMAFGSEIQIDNHNGYSDPLSVEFQAYNILNSFKIVEKNKGAGCIVNTFNDYLQNKPSLTTDNKLQYIHTSGLVDRNRRERLSFSTLQSLYNNEKEPLLNAGSFTRNTPVIYLIIGILLAILLIFLINRFKRFREYMFRSILRPYNFYADIRDQRIISSVQTVLLGIILSATVG
ncbi:MAG: glycoside hydrolase family 2 TIM barrel-domain containing protein, partial [Candidatus Kapabacteria bacterium]|nr:glycoside hydrolase family 2 TIM barrel-domain containing protein [Candidatus Kapabacteria bacterium]